MPKHSIVFGALLVGLGLLAFFYPEPLGVGKDGKPAEPGHPTSLSPVAIGSLLILAGAVSVIQPSIRKHAMHAAAMIGLMGALGGFIPVILRKFAIEEVAVKVGLGMAILSTIFVVLCVNSFVQARVLRKSNTPEMTS
jgi:nitrate/nitrite transporter NarK